MIRFISLFLTKSYYYNYYLRNKSPTHSTWDELIELMMYLRFLAKRSYTGTYRLFRTFLGTCPKSSSNFLLFLNHFSLILKQHLLQGFSY